MAVETDETLILGAGVTGLAAGLDSGALILEAADRPGGICRSYYASAAPSETGPVTRENSFRFEKGGGHWVFGADEELRALLNRFGAWRSYERRAAVYFPRTQWLVPFPLQYHLGRLPAALGRQAFEEMRQPKEGGAESLGEWLQQSFGQTLYEVFFRPFNALYTAGLLDEVAPENSYKSPLELAMVERGLESAAPPAGYNVRFLYPEAGLDGFVDALATRAKIRPGQRVAAVDGRSRRVYLDDGSSYAYQHLISTLPLDRMLAMTGIEVDETPDPATSVLVLNLGCVRGPHCPGEHWIYVPESRSGFHRVGFYSNVDTSFLPEEGTDLVSLYVERAFRRGQRPSPESEAKYAAEVVRELREWGWIDSLVVASPSWVDAAYTWRRPGSHWPESAIRALSAAGIRMMGRFGRWRFQGIAESLREGFNVHHDEQRTRHRYAGLQRAGSHPGGV